MPASDNVSKKLPFYLGVALFILFCLGGLVIAAIESSWVQKKMFAKVANALEESGWKATAETIKGSLFEKIRLGGVALVSPEGDEIRIGTLETSLSPLRLFRREIAFPQLRADQISWSLAEKREGGAIAAPSIALPFSLLISDLQLTGISLPESSETASLQGKLRIARLGKRAYINVRVEKEGTPNSFAILSLSLRRKGETVLECSYISPSIQRDLLPWYSIPADGSADLNLYARGTWRDFAAQLFGGQAERAIRGRLRGSCTVKQAPALHALLERRWTIFSSVSLDPDENLSISKLSLRGGSALHGKGDLVFSKNFGLKESNLQISAKSLKEADLAPIDGLVLLHLRSEGEAANLTLSSPELSWDGLSIQRAIARLHMEEKDGIWSGSAQASAKMHGEEAASNFTLRWDPGESMRLDQISLRSPIANAEGKVTIYQDKNIDGALNISTQNLHSISPSWPLFGKGDLTLRWRVEDGAQVLEVNAKAENLYYGTAQAQSAFFYADFTDKGSEIYGELQNVRDQSLVLETLSVEAESLDRVNWPLRFYADGDWKGPLIITSYGTAVYTNPTLSFDLEDLAGTLFFQPIAIRAPTHIEIGPSLFALRGFDLAIGSASLIAEIERKCDAVKGSLLFDRVPLDFLSLNPLDISVAGVINLNAQFSQKGKETEGELHAEILDIEIATLGTQDPVEGRTAIELSLSQKRLSLFGEMEIRGQETLKVSADLPCQLSFFPYSLHLTENEKAKASFAYNGRIEELLDFFDIGPHRLEGCCACRMQMRGTLAHPLLEGTCTLDDAYYENYVSGMELRHLHAEILGEKSSLYLRSLTAKDSQNKGNLSLSGKIDLLHQERFPYRFDGTFSRLNATDIAWMRLEAGGAIQISGDIDSARVSGQAVVLEGDVSIPERLPPSLPNIQVTYVNLVKPLAAEQANTGKQSRYPIFFDYRVLAPDGVYISGRGLDSEWRGDFQIGGTYTEIEAKGELSMLNGNFTFAGRSFELTEGSLTFSGRPKEMPILNIAARMQMQNLMLIARLKGYINAPQISFHSTPPLPMGSILSYLLFGQDMSDISAIQAAQIVTSLSTLSGQSPDVFDSTRRSIGVDRLRIVAAPVSESGAEAYSLQVGKYVTRGVLVSVSQGTEKDSTNLGVEIDLANGFVVEAESMQEEQQGKFTLKWNYNY